MATSAWPELRNHTPQMALQVTYVLPATTARKQLPRIALTKRASNVPSDNRPKLCARPALMRQELVLSSARHVLRDSIAR